MCLSLARVALKGKPWIDEGSLSTGRRLVENLGIVGWTIS